MNEDTGLSVPIFSFTKFRFNDPTALSDKMGQGAYFTNVGFIMQHLIRVESEWVGRGRGFRGQEPPPLTNNFVEAPNFLKRENKFALIQTVLVLNS